MLKTFKRNLHTKLIQKFSYVNRITLAVAYLDGAGIEIGAMNYPVVVKKGVKVKYYDRISREESYKIFPSINLKDLVKVDIIGDGEKLDNIKTESQDFVIANHFIEHCQNVVLTIENILRVLRIGGIIFMAIPDKRYTFDIERDITTADHLKKDYMQGPLWSEYDHYTDFVKFTDHGKGKSIEEIEEIIVKLKEKNWSIHFHVWDHQAMIEMFIMMKKDLGFKFEIELAQAAAKESNESIFILRKIE